MIERPNVITMKGKPLTLIGGEIQVNEKAPDFACLDNDLKAVGLKDYSGKVCILSSVPSLDTPVCDMETRRFNSEAERFGSEIQIITVSMDLPFAQKRWCGAAGIDRVVTLSDHREGSFGKAYGVLIKELRLLARAVFVVDSGGIVRYLELVRDIADEPDYQAILEALQKII